DDPSVSDEPQESDVHAQEGNAAEGDGIDVEKNARDAGNAESDTLLIYEFEVKPGALHAPPVVLTEPEQIPQKWLRIPVDFGRLQIDLAQDDAAIQLAVATFNTSMKPAIENAINAWASDADPATG